MTTSRAVMENETMEDKTFDTRLRAAVSAGGWMLLVAIGVATLQWLAYLALMSARPSWFLSLFGPNVGWSEVQRLWLQALVGFKLLTAVFGLVVLWGVLWMSKLRKRQALGTRDERSVGPAPRLEAHARAT
jgi:hypothetical protein